MAFFNFPFNSFPYTNFHELNLDWVLQTVKRADSNAEEALKSVDDATGAKADAAEALAIATELKANFPFIISDTDNAYSRRVLDDVLDGYVQEYINPPLLPNNIYRTIERFNGNPVYCACLVDIANGIDRGETREVYLDFVNGTPDYSQTYCGLKLTPISCRAVIVVSGSNSRIIEAPTIESGSYVCNSPICTVDRNADEAKVSFKYNATDLEGVPVEILWFVKFGLM